DCPDCEDSRALSLSFIYKSFTSSASFWESSIQIQSTNVLSFGTLHKWP
ncbi:hypothetical protein Tco_1258675, partial [Tanacetum coccineum]